MNPLWSSILLAVFLRTIHGSFATHVDLPPRSGSSGSHTINLTYEHNIYKMNITLGGKVFPVAADTGR